MEMKLGKHVEEFDQHVRSWMKKSSIHARENDSFIEQNITSNEKAAS